MIIDKLRSLVRRNGANRRYTVSGLLGDVATITMIRLHAGNLGGS
jgi:hypothetical protein